MEEILLRQRHLPLICLTIKNKSMKEIDQMLDKWIHNSIVRAKLRELIVSAIHTHAKTIIK